MTRVASLLAFVSVFWFPWPLTVALTLGIAFFDPFTPPIVGILADLLYAPHGAWPIFTTLGIALSLGALLVGSRLRGDA